MSLREELEKQKEQIERDLRASWCIGVHRDVAYKSLERVNRRLDGLKRWENNKTH